MGILSATHTSARTVLYMNKTLGINIQSVPLGGLDANVAALKSGQIDALYSSEGAALALVDSGVLRLLVPLSDIYPKPYTATVVWATERMIEAKPELVRRFVRASLEAVAYLKAHPDYARDLYIIRTKAPSALADKAVASLFEALSPSGRGSGDDLVAAAAGNWRFMIESGAVSPDTGMKMEVVVDARFLP
jgi:ABC-type nitrate/sulfonate/bicarbonate transport system substrate-binding protein